MKSFCVQNMRQFVLILLACTAGSAVSAVPVVDDNTVDSSTGLVAPVDSGAEGWLATATNALAAPAGQIAMHFAKEMISRSAGNSQPEPQRVVPPLTPITPKTSTDILSLNLSNLLVLVLLKALIFAAGLVGAGSWGHYARSRSDDNFFIGHDESPLLLGFLIAEGVGDDNCLRHAACTKPTVGAEYVRAAKALLQGAQLAGGPSPAYTEHYRSLIKRTDYAVVDGMKGVSCSAKYRCDV